MSTLGGKRVGMKVAAPDKGCLEVDGVTGRRYRARDGIYNMTVRDGRALVAAGGFAPSLAGHTHSTIGYRCTACEFGSYFRICSQCGGHCEREGDGDAPESQSQD